MKQYTERELDKKIHAFITSKVERFPELLQNKERAIDRAKANSGKSGFLSDIFSVKLKPIFK